MCDNVHYLHFVLFCYGCSHILWVIFGYFIHILNISFEIRVGQPTKSDFIRILKYFRQEIILKVIKFHDLRNNIFATTLGFGA